MELAIILLSIALYLSIGVHVAIPCNREFSFDKNFYWPIFIISWPMVLLILFIEWLFE
jgi:ABC-type sugar transport system permease subunit